MTQAVLFETLATTGGRKIGVATLNAEKKLNSLSVEMVELLRPQLQQWEQDDSIVCVWLQGAGEKAFCAGG
ncbi:MAG TPA: enoyl-CoA hydratase/isomerase family protein, partial [Candidatus Kapabacteria bacterium]|nr:enoyl-CoA hydratase/isomerase family protein [Candidatus Kapabacteria bacterium]